MKCIDLYLSYKDKYPHSIVIMQLGNFYEIFDKDTVIINLLCNYKIRKVGSIDRTGFPLCSLYKVINILNQNKINYIIIDNINNNKIISVKKTYKNNSYDYFIKKSSYIISINTRIDNIYNKLKNKDYDSITNILESIENII